MIVAFGFAASAQDVTEEQPRGEWILANSEIGEGSTAHAWLVVYNFSEERDSISIELYSSSDAGIRFTSSSQNSKWQGTIGSDSVFKLQVTPISVKSVRLFAKITDLKLRKSFIVLSNEIAIDSFEVGDTFLSILTALIAFIAGVLTNVIQTQYDHWLERKKARASIEDLYIEKLTPELIGHQQALEDYLKANDEISPPILSPMMYNQVMETDGYLSYLDNDLKKKYWRRLEEYYMKVREFNSKVRSSPSKEIVREQLKFLRDQFKLDSSS